MPLKSRKRRQTSRPRCLERKTDAPAEKLTLTLSYPKDSPENVTLKVAWGKLAPSAPIEVVVAE